MFKKKYFNIQYRLFHNLGINISNLRTGAFVSSSRFYSTMILEVLFLVPLFAYALSDITDVDKITESMSFILVIVSSVVKIWIFLHHRLSIMNLIIQIREVLTAEKNEEFVKIINFECQRDQTMSAIYIFTVGLTGFTAIIHPLLIMGYKTIKNEAFVYILPLAGTFPYDTQNFINYTLSFLWASLTVYSIIFYNVSMDTLFCGLTHNLCAYFKVIGLKFSRTHPPDDFRSILIEHQNALDISGKLSKYFRELLLAEFFIATLQICVNGYQISRRIESSSMLFFLFYFVAVLVQIFVYAYCGQKVQEDSTAISRNIIEGAVGYPQYYERTRCMVHMVLMRSHRPCKLDGYFFEANLKTFTSVSAKIILTYKI